MYLFGYMKKTVKEKQEENQNPSDVHAQVVSVSIEGVVWMCSCVVCTGTCRCARTWTCSCEARIWHWMSSWITPTFIWNRVSWWTWSSPIQIGWPARVLQESVYLCTPTASGTDTCSCAIFTMNTGNSN